MSNVKTINGINLILTDIADRHYQINTYGWGQNWDIATTDDITYPLLWANPVTATMLKSISNDNYPTMEVIINIQVLDLINDNSDNEKDVESDTLQIISDVVHQFNNHPYYQKSNMLIIGDIAIDPLDEVTDDDTTGWNANITFKLINTNSCDIPASTKTGTSYPE